MGISSSVNGQEILEEEELLHTLFGVSSRGCIVKTEKGVKEFIDENANKIGVDIAAIEKWMLKNAGLVKVEAKLLDQNDFGAKWKMVHFITPIPL